MAPLPYKLLWRRAPAVLAGVLLAHVLPWHSLRWATADACVWFAQALGLEASRLYPYTVGFPGWNVRMDTSCTLIDLYLGALPLLWSGRVLQSVGRMVVFFFLLMTVNIVRLVGGFWLIQRGVSWELAHEVVAGLLFYAIFEALCAVLRQNNRTSVTLV